MSENPYQSPSVETSGQVLGVISGSREDLRRVAVYQKGILVCILLYFIAIASQLLLPQEFRLLLGVGVLGLGVTGTVFVFLLAIKVYSPILGALLGLLVLLPCIGLIVLLIVNGKATSILKSNGIRVGLMGAKLSQV